MQKVPCTHNHLVVRSNPRWKAVRVTIHAAVIAASPAETYPFRWLYLNIRLGPRERGESVYLTPELSRFAARRRLE